MLRLKIQPWEKDNEVKVKTEVKALVKEVVSTEKKNKLSYKEERELEEIDTQIPALELQIANLTDQLNGGVTDHSELAKIALNIEELKGKLDVLSLRWLELMEVKEA